MLVVRFYLEPNGYNPVMEYIERWPEKQQNKIFAFISRLEVVGHRLQRPTAGHIGGGTGLYYLRPNRHRIFYFFHDPNRVILVHAFVKQSDQIPHADLQLALKRKNDWIRRYT